MREQEIRQLVALSEKASRIANVEVASWETKFDLIFSDSLSGDVKRLAPNFRYFDPDSDYEDDVLAYVRALDEYVKDLALTVIKRDPADADGDAQVGTAIQRNDNLILAYLCGDKEPNKQPFNQAMTAANLIVETAASLCLCELHGFLYGQFASDLGRKAGVMWGKKQQDETNVCPMCALRRAKNGVEP